MCFLNFELFEKKIVNFSLVNRVCCCTSQRQRKKIHEKEIYLDS